MKRATVTLQTVLCILTTTALLMAGGTPEFEMTRSTIDGGGVMRSAGEGYELSGSIGQPDAGTMSGGDFELAGGFWPGASSGGGGCTRDPEWQCDGDTDGDGQVNPVDSGLVQAAFGSTDESDLCQYDLDCDGQINPVDSGIVQSLFGTCDPPRDGCP